VGGNAGVTPGKNRRGEDLRARSRGDERLYGRGKPSPYGKRTQGEPEKSRRRGASALQSSRGELPSEKYRQSPQRTISLGEDTGEELWHCRSNECCKTAGRRTQKQNPKKKKKKNPQKNNNPHPKKKNKKNPKKRKGNNHQKRKKKETKGLSEEGRFNISLKDFVLFLTGELLQFLGGLETMSSRDRGISQEHIICIDPY